MPYHLTGKITTSFCPKSISLVPSEKQSCAGKQKRGIYSSERQAGSPPRSWLPRNPSKSKAYAELLTLTDHPQDEFAERMWDHSPRRDTRQLSPERARTTAPASKTEVGKRTRSPFPHPAVPSPDISSAIHFPLEQPSTSNPRGQCSPSV